MKKSIVIDDSAKKILVIGANGFLGANIIKLRLDKTYQEQKFIFLAADIENSNMERDVPFYFIDITKSKSTVNKILKISPDVIILTASMTNVDQNEINKGLAKKINIDGPKNVLKACKKIDSKLIFMSTDFIFDGISKDGNYKEDDLPNPQNYYGKTKKDAESAIINSEIDFLICRTAVLYGWNNIKLNFITWILNKLEQNEKIKIITNQTNNPTFIRNLAEIILKLIEKDARGIYHSAGDGALSRYEMALQCAEIFDYNKDLITPVDEIAQSAIRPKNVGLDISKLKNLIGAELSVYNLKDGLKYMKLHRIK